MVSSHALVLLTALLPALVLGEPCRCIYEGTTLPTAAAAQAGNPLYGTSCATKWDMLPGTLWYKNDTECPPSKACEKGCNFQQLNWCYVKRGCTGAAHFNTSFVGNGDLAYSYELCGNPYCWHPYGWDEVNCPAGDACDANKCKCQFEGTTLPPAAAAQAGNPLYGTSCATKWDMLPGTLWYKNDTECPPSKVCEKGCNFQQLNWCYVKRGCAGAAHFNTSFVGNGDMAYSYEMCGNPYCWHPYGWDEAKCPAGNGCEQTTCGAVKEAYKTQGCCGSPAKKVNKSVFM